MTFEARLLKELSFISLQLQRTERVLTGQLKQVDALGQCCWEHWRRHVPQPASSQNPWVLEAALEQAVIGDLWECASLTPSHFQDLCREVVESHSPLLKNKADLQIAHYRFLTALQSTWRRQSRLFREIGARVRGRQDLLTFLPARIPQYAAGERPPREIDLEVIECLGMGGQGEIYKVKSCGRFWVLKVPTPAEGRGLFGNDTSATCAITQSTSPMKKARDRLVHEAYVSSAIQQAVGNRNLIPVALSLTGPTANPPALLFPFVEAHSLSDFILASKRSGAKPLNPTRVLSLMGCLSRAVGELDSAQFVHRDIKPSNILVKYDRSIHKWVIHLIDVGVSAGEGYRPEEYGVGTTTGRHEDELMSSPGTAPYASPQQRERKGQATPADDVHALGVTWLHALLGDSQESPRGSTWERRLWDKNVPEDHIELLSRCFHEDPDQRPADANVLAEALGGLLIDAMLLAPTQPPGGDTE